MFPRDAIDFHVHAAPSVWERKHDVVELARMARDAGLGGLVIKNHLGNTFPQTAIANELVPGVQCFSSITLNSFVGGFNPDAVAGAIESGARVIWMPTFTAEHYRSSGQVPFARGAVSAVDETGALTPAAVEVLEVIEDADPSPVLCTGHVSPAETYAVLDHMEEAGMDIPFVITHADANCMNLTMEDQATFASRGAYLEKCYRPIIKEEVSIEAMVESIDSIGADRCILSTDHGQPDCESPPAALGSFAATLRDSGISESDIDRMGRELPRSLLGAD